MVKRWIDLNMLVSAIICTVRDCGCRDEFEQ